MDYSEPNEPCYVYLKTDTKQAESRKGKADCTTFCKLMRCDWYWGALHRSKAEALVLKHQGTFIIRDSYEDGSILCITFLVDINPNTIGFPDFDPICKSGDMWHVNIKYYKGLFSLDKKEYVRVDELAEHCTRVGREYNIFNAHALPRDAFRRVVMKKRICDLH